MITKHFILAKDFNRIGVRILRDHHGAVIFRAPDRRDARSSRRPTVTTPVHHDARHGFANTPDREA
jgi:hypothetical protein